MNLFIDTHLFDLVILLTKDNEIVDKIIIKDEKENSKVLMPGIVKILDGRSPESIIVVNGPGSFTGVRLGVTIAKTLAYTLNIPIRTITSLECLAVSADSNEKIVSFSDNNGYYVGRFDQDNNLLGEYEYLNNTEYEVFKNNNKVTENIDINYEKVIEFTMKKNPINPHQVNPIYIKKIAVEK